MNSNPAVRPGKYAKPDGYTIQIEAVPEKLAAAESFDPIPAVVICEEQRSELIPRPRTSSSDPVIYSLTWKWGTATMEYIEEGMDCILVENGVHRFTRQCNDVVAAHHSVTLMNPGSKEEEGDRPWMTTAERSLLQSVGFCQLRRRLDQQTVKNVLSALEPTIGDKDGWVSVSTTDPNVLGMFDALLPTIRELTACPWLPPPNNAQVAIVGTNDSRPPLEANEIGRDWHIDGLHTPDNGVPENSYSKFSVLVGVLLSDTPRPNCGNFCAVPGSHKILAERLRRHPRGVNALHIPENAPNIPHVMRDVFGDPERDLPTPQCVLGGPGTVYMIQAGTIHFVQPNVYGSGPRVALYVRFNATGRYDGGNALGLLHPELELPL